jgi:hypothetical protein
MAKPIQAAPSLNFDRRQLLASVAVITTAGLAPNAEAAGATNAAEAVNPATSPASNVSAFNICVSTARKIEEISQRNRIRQQAGLPLLSIPKELRKIKNAELAAELEEFADRHRQAVWDEVLTPIREAKGDPNWRPKGMMEGLGYQARVSKVLRQRFVAQLRVK